jgi:aryl-alcohol dehydrogenase-like predicted oxidoreductase
MTFGTSRWGFGEDESRSVFNTYVDAGENLVDTTDLYSEGRSEEMIGKFISKRSLRDHMVVATKFGFAVGL